MKQIISICLGTVLVLASLGATACNPGNNNGNSNVAPVDQVLINAQRVIDSVKQAQPLIAQYLPNNTADIAGILDATQKLVTYEKAADKTNVRAQLVGDGSPGSGIIPVFESIVANDIPRLSQANQTQILSALAAADIALHLLLDLLVPPAPAATASQGPIERFRSEPVWGKNY